MEIFHSSREIIGSRERSLAGKKIVLCVTGSVAACRAPEIAREAMRRGAEVVPVISPAAAKLVGPDLLWWATGNKPVTELTGACEHVSLAGKTKGRFDAVLVAPATANTLGKAANGIDDTPVSTVIATALGSRMPVLFAPAMHSTMYENTAVGENLKKLEAMGCVIIPPVKEREKAKLAPDEEIIDFVEKSLSQKPLAGKKVVVTAGATREFIDDVRFISNPSSGRMGVELARKAWMNGADVKLVHGAVSVKIPGYLKAFETVSLAEMKKAVLSEKADFFLIPGAPADFILAKREKGKISSARELTLKLAPAPKIRSEIKKRFPEATLVLFKAESGVGDSELEVKARTLLEESGADIVVANDVAREGAGFASETNEVLIVGKKGVLAKEKGSKREIAEKIIRALTTP